MRKLIKQLSHQFRLSYTMKAMAFAKAPGRIKVMLLVLQTLYLQFVSSIMGDAMFGLWGAIWGAALAAVASFLYFRALDRDGQDAMEQVEAMLIDEKIPFRHQYPGYVEGVGDGQDSSRV